MKKISINKNKQIYFFLFFLYSSILIFYTSPRQWGLRGDLLLAKDEIVISCLLESWYCLPDSHLLHICNPETTSRVTLASLGTVFQTDWLDKKEISIEKCCFVVLLFCCLLESVGTVFQTAAYFMFVIPRLRPGLLSLRSVLSSRQTDWLDKK